MRLERQRSGKEREEREEAARRSQQQKLAAMQQAVQQQQAAMEKMQADAAKAAQQQALEAVRQQQAAVEQQQAAMEEALQQMQADAAKAASRQDVEKLKKGLAALGVGDGELDRGRQVQAMKGLFAHLPEGEQKEAAIFDFMARFERQVADLQATVVQHETALVGTGAIREERPQARPAPPPPRPQVQVERFVQVGDHAEYALTTTIGADRHSAQRRVTDFRKLHEKLSKRPQLALGAFPIAKVLHFFQTEAVKRRRQFELQKYLNAVLAAAERTETRLDALPELLRFLNVPQSSIREAERASASTAAAGVRSEAQREQLLSTDPGRGGRAVDLT
jgi:hypothetical protein